MSNLTPWAALCKCGLIFTEIPPGGVCPRCGENWLNFTILNALPQLGQHKKPPEPNPAERIICPLALTALAIHELRDLQRGRGILGEPYRDFLCIHSELKPEDARCPFWDRAKRGCMVEDLAYLLRAALARMLQ